MKKPGDNKLIKQNEIGAVNDDIWKFGSIGSITAVGGASFYKSLYDKKWGFSGMLRRRDKIVLVSTEGFCNYCDDENLVCKVMVLNSHSKKLDEQIGWVSLTDTSYYTLAK